jgi:hypothetical protein
LSLLMLAPLVIPGVILGISILAFASRLAQFADDTWGLELEFLRPGLPLVVLGQFSYIVSIATLTISARLKRFDRTLEDAAYNLGASRAGRPVDRHPALPETGPDRRGGDLVPDVVRELQHHADAGRLRPAADGHDVRPHARRVHAGAQRREPVPDARIGHPRDHADAPLRSARRGDRDRCTAANTPDPGPVQDSGNRDTFGFRQVPTPQPQGAPMRRPALYSNSVPRASTAQASMANAAAAAAIPQTAGRLRRMLPLLATRACCGWPSGCWRWLVVVISLLLRPPGRKLTQEDIDAAVLKTLETNTLPSAAAKAAEVIAPSVVRVMSYEIGVNGRDEIERGVGTGVVIVDKGIILTNLHVVQGAELIKVTFSDGLEAVASIKSVQPEDDLAVLQAHKIPDDLIAATMRSTGDLMPGDQVVAVGFPFGIGPSTSSGVVSGLKRPSARPKAGRK